MLIPLAPGGIEHINESRTLDNRRLVFLGVEMIYDGRYLSKVQFSSFYHCDSPMRAARWYETFVEQCRPPRARCIWTGNGYLYLCSGKNPRQSFARFLIRSIRNQPLLLANHPKKIIILASMDKGTRNTCLLTIFCHFKSPNDAIEWRIVLQKSKAVFEKQRQSEQQRLDIMTVTFEVEHEGAKCEG